MHLRSRLLRAAHGKFGYLLVALITLIVAAPIITTGVLAQVLLAVLASTVLVAGLYAARPSRSSLVIGLVLAGIDLGIGQLSRDDPANWVLILQATLWLTTLLFVALVILEVVLSSRPVTLQTLQAAFCVFLLLGLVWAYSYFCLTVIQPSSFDSPDSRHLRWDDVPSRRGAFLSHLIFSYSTLAAATYPGLTPVSDLANILASLEAMMAQVFLAVVIARLVGLQASDAAETEATAARHPPVA